MSYLPVPPRAWTRVQNQCTYINPDTSYNSIYIPLTGQTLSPGEALYYDKQQYKGNILQYKGNSAGLTRNQRYAQLAKGNGPNRTKVFATQSQTYTNPNTSGLLRVNTKNYQFPNNVVGEPNNPAGPFQYNVQSPFGCASNTVKDGGNLVSGTYENQCTGEIIIKETQSATKCFPTYCSGVPGEIQNLCWNSKQQTWFPRQRLYMNNSTNKWPEGYKGFVSAIRPPTPVITFTTNTEKNLTLISWTINPDFNIPVSQYKLYCNNTFLTFCPYNTDYVEVRCNAIYSFYVKSMFSGNQNTESEPSNVIYNTAISVGSFDYKIITTKVDQFYIDGNVNVNILENIFNCTFYYHIMENFAIKQINEYLVNFSNDYSTLVIPFETYNMLGIELVRFEQTFDKNNCLIDVIRTYKAILITLGKYIDLRTTLGETVRELEKCKLDVEVLHDIEKLKKYLEQFRSVTTLFGDVEVNDIIPAQVNPLYAKYNQIYGVPPDFVYDPEKLYLIETSMKEISFL
jgi:hypothetical protein